MLKGWPHDRLAPENLRSPGQDLDPIKAALEAALQKLRRCGYFSLAA
jgi:hypothetical protein